MYYIRITIVLIQKDATHSNEIISLTDRINLWQLAEGSKKRQKKTRRKKIIIQLTAHRAVTGGCNLSSHFLLLQEHLFTLFICLFLSSFVPFTLCNLIYFFYYQCLLQHISLHVYSSFLLDCCCCFQSSTYVKTNEKNLILIDFFVLNIKI